MTAKASVLVIAAFLCTLMAALTPLILDNARPAHSTAHTRSIIIDTYFSQNGPGIALPALQPAVDTLRRVPGAHPVVGYSPVQNPTAAVDAIVISCADFPSLGEAPCAPKNAAVKLPLGFGGAFGEPVFWQKPEQLATPITAFQQHPVLKLMTGVQGGQAAVDRVRTAMAQHPQLLGDPFFTTPPEQQKQERKTATQVRYVVNGAFLLVLFVASCSLAIQVGGSLIERKRPFGLLRVAGASLAQLRLVVLIEFVVPLLAAITIAAGLGFLVAVLLVASFADQQTPVLQALPADYYIVTALGIGVAVGVMLATLPLLAAATKPEHTRFE